MRNRHWFSGMFFLLTMVFFYAPLAVLIIYSFNDSRTMAWGGVSFRWYVQLFTRSKQLWQSVGNSVLVALTSAACATVLGTLGAIGTYWYQFRLKKYVQVATFLPLILPEIIMGVSLLIFFAGVRLPLSLFTVFIAHVTFTVPFVLLLVMARLEEFDYSIVEAAYDLGAKETDALLRVIVPVTLPGIVAGFLMAVTLSLEDFVVTFFVAGPGASTIPLHVYSMMRFGVSPVINALSVVLIAITVILAFSTRNFYRYIIGH
jgi:spermidine/putrescine transport system permease protein